MTVISSLVMICIYYLLQLLQFPEKLLVRVKKRRGGAASDQNRNGGLPVAIKANKYWNP